MNTTKQQSRWFLLLAGLSVAMSLSFGMSTARGGLLFSDSFQYPPGPLAGQGTWTVFAGANPQVIPLGLQFGRLFSAGGATTFSDIGTFGDEAIDGLAEVHKGIVYIGFLIQDVDAVTSGYAVLGAGFYFSGYGLISGTGAYGIDNNNGQRALTPFGPAVSKTDWLVVKLDFHTLTQYLYVNPRPGRTEPPVPDATLSMPFYTLDMIRINVGNNNGSYAFDEVRIATTFLEISRGH